MSVKDPLYHWVIRSNWSIPYIDVHTLRKFLTRFNTQENQARAFRSTLMSENQRKPRIPQAAVLFTLSLLLATTIILPGCDKETSGTIAAKISGQWFTLEVSETSEKRALGFMNRTEIPADSGMIFVFNDSQERSFWMKNCLIDMDILYLDRGMSLISAYNMKAQPPQADNETEIQYEDRIRAAAAYPSRGAAQFVIELKAGKIQELKLARGDKVTLDQDQLKTLVRAADPSP